MQDVTLAEPALEIREVGEPLEFPLVPFEPEPEVVEATWRYLPEPPPLDFKEIDYPKSMGFKELPSLETKPYTLNQRLTDEAKDNGQMFGRPIEQPIRQASSWVSAHSPLSETVQQESLVDTVAGLFESVVSAIESFVTSGVKVFENTFLFSSAPSSQSRPRQNRMSANKIHMSVVLSRKQELMDYFKKHGLPTKYERVDELPIPEYVFSISAGHLKWAIKLLHDVFAKATHDETRAVYVISLPISTIY